jgi:hypothetical protein
MTLVHASLIFACLLAAANAAELYMASTATAPSAYPEWTHLLVLLSHVASLSMLVVGYVYDREGNFGLCSARKLGGGLALNLGGYFLRGYLIVAFADYRPTTILS